MDENNIAEVETEETELNEQINSAFDEEWGDAPADDDDFDLSDEPEAAEPEDQREEADEPEETEAAPEEAPETEPEQAEEPAAEEKPEDQRFHLKHNGEEHDVDTAEVVALAQKGLDYDRVRQERDTFKEQHPTFKAYESFLTELAEASGTDIPGLMEQTRATLLVQKAKAEGKELSEAAAIAQIRAESRKAAEKPAAEEPKPEKTPEQEQEEQRKANVAAFVKAYPGVKAEDIPKEVWEDCFRTGDLAGAYARWENRKLKAENEQLKQNQKNKERSTGSRRSAGATSPKDAFDEGWDSI